MRRSLVLTHEAARHPFRASLPPPRRLTRYRRKPWPCWAVDLRDFLMSFCAFFLATMIFIA